MKNKPCIWVVEIKSQRKNAKNWLPTAGAWIEYRLAKLDIERWRAGDPEDLFRITKYFPEG